MIIVYPHTTNWDFIIGVLAKWAVGLPFHWFGKEALFKDAIGMAGTDTGRYSQ
jgi:1-acyl-sn-glycerol-3-phosphate acyltransferase